MYPSAPLLLVHWTGPRFPGSRVLTSTPANLQTVLSSVESVIRIQRSGGGRKYTLDRASIDLDIFATTLEAADRICGEVANAWEFTMPGALIDSGTHGRAVVAKVDITSGPSQRPTADGSLSRVGATAAIVLHSA